MGEMARRIKRALGIALMGNPPDRLGKSGMTCRSC